MDELELIEELDREQGEWVSEFTDALAVLLSAVSSEIDSLLGRMLLNGRATTADELRSNMRMLTMWQADLPGLIDRLGYRQSVATLATNMGTGAGTLIKYFQSIDPTFTGTEYTALVGRLTELTRSILVTGMEANVSRVISETLNWSVLTKSTASEIRTALKQQLDANGLAVRNLSLLADDAVHTFSRGYSSAIAEGLGLEHYLFAGTIIATTRDFCEKRAGKVYRKSEVESWADLSWSGKMPGTTRQTIFWYAGGRRCRHRLLPISENTYLILSKQV